MKMILITKLETENYQKTRTEYTKSIVRNDPSPYPGNDTTFNTNNFHEQKTVNIEKDNNEKMLYNFENFNTENEKNLINFIEEQKHLTKIMNDIKFLLKEGISKSKIFVEANNNSKRTISPLNNTEEILNLSDFNSNKSKKSVYHNKTNNIDINNIGPEIEISKAKKIEAVLLYCSLIDNLAVEIKKFSNEKNEKKLQILMNSNGNNIENNGISENFAKIDPKRISNINMINPLAKSIDCKSEIQNNTFRSNLKGSFLIFTHNKTYNVNSNLNLNQTSNHCSLEREPDDIQIDEYSLNYFRFESFKRKSVYKSLFKNCKNTLNELIQIYKSKIKEENLIMNESVSSVVNNLTNNINFNFNFNVPKYNVSSRSQEYKNMINNKKKEKNNIKDFTNNNINNNQNNQINPLNNNNENHKEEAEIRNPMKHSNFTDYSVFEESNENIGGLKIWSFKNMPKRFFSYKIKNENFTNNNINNKSNFVNKIKNRAKSLDSKIEEFNPAYNSQNHILIENTNNLKFLNTLVKEENITSIKLPISKIRNVTLEDYNKNCKIYFARFVNLNSKNLFKRISSKINQEIEKEFDMEVNVNNLNISYELDNTNSKKHYPNFFLKESIISSSKKLIKNKIKENYVSFKNDKKKEKNEIYNDLFKNTDNTYYFNKLTETNVIKNIEEEDNCLSDNDESYEDCNLNISDDDEKNVFNVIKIRSKKMMQKFMFNSSNKNLIINANGNNITNNKKDVRKISNFLNLNDSHANLFNNVPEIDKTIKSNYIYDRISEDQKSFINKNPGNINIDFLKSESKIKNLNISSCKDSNDTITSGIFANANKIKENNFNNSNSFYKNQNAKIHLENIKKNY
jgi:hypothetical protein